MRDAAGARQVKGVEAGGQEQIENQASAGHRDDAAVRRRALQRDRPAALRAGFHHQPSSRRSTPSAATKRRGGCGAAVLGLASWLRRPRRTTAAASSAAWKRSQSASLLSAAGVAPSASAMRSSAETMAWPSMR